MLVLSSSPSQIPGADGVPPFGAYAGELGPVDLDRLAPPHALPRWARRLRRKRWHYALYTTPELVVDTLDNTDPANTSVGTRIFHQDSHQGALA